MSLTLAEARQIALRNIAAGRLTLPDTDDRPLTDHKNYHTFALRVPVEKTALVEDAAAKDGISVARWLRRVVLDVAEDTLRRA